MTSVDSPSRSASGRTPESSPSAPAEVWPRLLVVGSFLSGFGLERYAGGDMAVEIMRDGGKVITASHRRSRPFRLAEMLWTAYRRRKDYDLAHLTVFSGRAFIYAECVAALLSALGKPCTLGLHGGNLPDFARRHPRRIRWLLQRAAQVVCPSRYLLENMKPFRADLHLIPNAIHLKHYPLRSPAAAGFRLLWLRAFHEIYNPCMAVRALAQLCSTQPSDCGLRTSDFQLTMIGPDKGDGSLQRLKAEIQRLKLEGQVSLRGAVPKAAVPQVMAQHDVFINTTNIDNLPVSVIEAMACGLPVVSTDVGGIPYLVEHGTTGLLVKPGDSAAMAAAVKSLFGDPALAARLSAQGRKLAASFDWEVVLPQWRQHLNGVFPVSR